MCAAQVAQTPRVHWAVHVADQMYQTLDMKGYGGIGAVSIVSQLLDGRLDSENSISLKRPQRIRIRQPGIDRRSMPLAGKSVFGGIAVLVHPFGVVDDRMSVQITLDARTRLAGKMPLRDFRNCFVSLASPSECRRRSAQYER